jgi:pimeloyl-ACP methyl ester carboxylesterase
MYSRAINLNDAVLGYDVQGNGSRALLVFHGAGQDRSVFHHLPEALKATYRIYAFDLFFHGQSRWESDEPLEKKDWQALMKRFFEVEQVNTLDVLGYSIGARFALATLELFPEKVRACYLVAPDGISISPWYSLATGTAAGRRIFERCLSSPSLVPNGLELAVKLGILDSAAARFIDHQLNTAPKRDRIYHMWVSFRRLKFSRSTLRHLINSHSIVVFGYIGTRDIMVRTEPVRKFLKRLKSAHLEIIDANHRRILTEALERIARL